MFIKQMKFLLQIIAFTILFCNFCYADNKTVVPVQKWHTINGAKVLFVENPQIPMANIIVAFDAGSARDEQNPGVAKLTMAMLNQGTNKMNADVIAKAFDDIGVIYNIDTDQDMSTISLTTLTKADVLSKAIALLNQILTQASFPNDAFKQNQNVAIQSIKSEEQDPDTVAYEKFMTTLYGNNPYGHPVDGTIQSVSVLTPALLQKFYQQYFVAKNAVIIIVGDLSKAKAEAVSNEITSNLPQGEKAPVLANATTTKNKSVHINFPSSQTTIYLGSLGIKRNTPDYFPLVVANFILGGDVSSLLSMNIREKQGYTYSIYSYFLPLQNQGPFIISFQSRNQKANDALELTKKLTEAFFQEGPTANELATAKQSLIGSFPLKIDSNANIASYLLIMGFYNLPLTYLDDFRSNINNVTLPQIQSALKRFHVKDMVTVTVGGNSKVNGA